MSQWTVGLVKRAQMSLFITLGVWLGEGTRMAKKFGQRMLTGEWVHGESPMGSQSGPKLSSGISPKHNHGRLHEIICKGENTAGQYGLTPKVMVRTEGW